MASSKIARPVSVFLGLPRIVSVYLDSPRFSGHFRLLIHTIWLDKTLSVFNPKAFLKISLYVASGKL